MMRRSLLIATVFLGTALAQKAAVPKQSTQGSQAQEKVKELLLSMDTDKNGRISKPEWMKFMEAEFDRLDKDHRGEIDQKELLQSTVSVRRVRQSDLGK
jgi:Ca2+-binding EF-hand superfamily protein